MFKQMATVWACLIGILCLTAEAWAQTPTMQAKITNHGVASLTWGRVDLLADGKPRVNQVILEKKWPNEQGVNEFSFEKLEGDPTAVSFDAKRNTLTYTYDWGTISFAYRVKADRLEATTTIDNRSKRTLAMFDITPLSLRLPEDFEKPKRWQKRATMPGDFNVVEVATGEHKLLLCGETVMPLRLAFGNPRQRAMPIRISGNVNMLEPGGVVYHHYGLPRVAPGESLTIEWSLRVADAEADTWPLIADLVEGFRDYHRPGLVWKDRRPVGAIFLGAGRGPDNNPRNWFKDQKLDVRTEEGRKELRQRMMKHADQCIRVLKSVNAQGMVLWDPEGAENPHPTTYIGDPRMVEIIAPEMVDIYPDYFKRFHEAGLRTGVCLRPTQVARTPYTGAVDGDVETSWALQVAPQWIEIDLGKEHPIDRTQLICFVDRAYQFKVEARPAQGEYTTIVDRTNNTTPGKVDAPITDKFEPVKARYVKLTITGAHEYDGKWVNVREFRVFAGDSENLALNNASDRSRRFGRAIGGHGTGAFNPDRNPLDDDFSDIWPEGVPWWRFYPIVERMSRKIEFAKKHWGCTLFYVDTNGVHRPVGEDQQFEWTLLDVHVWRDLQRRHPDVLLIPEFAPNPGQLAHTSLYLQPPYSPPVLREQWRKWLPGAFGVSYTVNLNNEDWESLRPRLVEGIKAGDSLFFRGWFGDHYNKKIKTLYDEVYEPDATNPGLPESYLNQKQAERGGR